MKYIYPQYTPTYIGMSDAKPKGLELNRKEFIEEKQKDMEVANNFRLYESENHNEIGVAQYYKCWYGI